MHDIEPHFKWREEYDAAKDPRSPFYGRVYDEFMFSQKVYNYYIHPQWDAFGSPTLYAKILFADYDERFAIIELIGEWNDAIHNDIMFLKRDLADHLHHEGIQNFILITENVLNFHGSDDCYYEEWYDDVSEWNGWVCLLNLFEHVEEEMDQLQLGAYIHYGPRFNGLNWRIQKPRILFRLVSQLVAEGETRLLTGAPH